MTARFSSPGGRALTWVALLFLATAAPVPAAAPLRPFLDDHCAGCHGGDKPKGALDVSRLALPIDDPGRLAAWIRVFDRVAEGDMPPKNRAQPAPEERQAFLDDLRGRLHEASLAAQKAAGRAALRRLNRVEYENTLRDLLGTQVHVRDLMPEDGSAAGFDTGADGLDVAPTHLAKYLSAADKALDEAIARGPWSGVREVVSGKTWFDRIHPNVRKFAGRSFDQRDGVGTLYEQDPRSGDVDVTTTHPPPVPGLYRFRLTAAARNTGGKPLPLRIYWQDVPAHLVPGHLITIAYRDLPAGGPATIEFLVDVPDDRAGRNRVGIQTTTLPQIPRYDGPTPPAPDPAAAPAFEVHRLEVEGPLGGWPTAGHRLLFDDLSLEPRSVRDARAGKKPVAEDWSSWPRERFAQDPLVPVADDPAAAAERLVRRFLPKIFRRPVPADLAVPFVKIAQDRLARGDEFGDAVRASAKAALCSPHFFMLLAKPGPLDDYALASRLSYFLWKSAPDDELLAVAGRGSLRDPAALHAQVDRMLADPKARRFVSDFVAQWLDVRSTLAMKPDDAYFEYDTALALSLVPETELFFAEMLANDRSVTEFVQSDWTFLNARLAKHYGVPGVEGSELRKVSLKPEYHRGGVLTHASVLKATANGSYTSPVKRGVWVLDRLLGRPPLPPPPDVPAIEPDIRGTTTLRQRLEKHRQHAACAGCHARIDPPGFALENYDVLGGYRTRYRDGSGPAEHLPNYPELKPVLLGTKVDASGTTAEGGDFRDLDGLKQLLLQDSDQLTRTLARKLLVYGTGADIQFADREEVERIVTAVRGKGRGLRSLLHEVVASRPFLNR